MGRRIIVTFEPLYEIPQPNVIQYEVKESRFKNG